MQTIAITGANGFIGSALCRYFGAHGYTIRPLVRCPTNPQSRQFVLGKEIDSHTLQGVDIVIHAAYDFTVRHWEDVYEINVQGSKKLFHAAHEIGIRKIIFISSVSAFAGCRSLYGRAKLATEDLLLAVGGYCVRPGLVFGDPKHGMFGALWNTVARFSILPVFDGGHQPLAFIHIEDLAALIQAIIMQNRPTTEKPVIAAHHEIMTFRGVLLEIARQQGKRIRLFSIPACTALSMLKIAETIGINLPFRSDSLLGLLNPNPKLDFSSYHQYNIQLRSFQ